MEKGSDPAQNVNEYMTILQRLRRHEEGCKSRAGKRPTDVKLDLRVWIQVDEATVLVISAVQEGMCGLDGGETGARATIDSNVWNHTGTATHIMAKG